MRKRSFALIFSIFLILYQLNNTWVSITETEKVTGCDSYGYSKHAKLFKESPNSLKAFDTSINGDVQKVLISWANQTNLPSKEWYQMIAPHAHHYRDSTRKIINQYPYGTGWLLSFFPEGINRRSLWIISYFGIASLFLFCIRTYQSILLNSSLTLFGIGSLYVTNSFVIRSDSLAPSCLFAAGISFLVVNIFSNINPGSDPPYYKISLFGLLIGASLSFRPGNIIFISSALALLWLILKIKKSHLLKSILYFSIPAFISSLPLWYANFINTGNIFTSTYSVHDTTFSFNMLIPNIIEILKDGNPIATVLTFSFLFSSLLLSKQLSDLKYLKIKILITSAWLGMFTMILLICLKTVFNPYYIVSQVVMTNCMISFAGIITETPNNISNDRILKRIIPLSLSLIILLSGFTFLSFQKQLADKNPLPLFDSKNSILWADSYGSDLNYLYDINTAKLSHGSHPARKEVIAYLTSQGIQQFVLDQNSYASKFDAASSGSLKKVSEYRSFNIYKYTPNPF